MASMPEKIPAAVAILTRNSAATLPRALESVREFAEIIVCDGGSTDGTLELARAAGARVIAQEPRFKDGAGRISDFAGVRNQTLAAASRPWFFFLDSDEYLAPAIVAEIGGIVSRGAPAAYWVPRKYVVEGVVIACAATYPTNKQIRFFHKDAAATFIKTIHEKIELKKGARVLALANPMYVPMTNDPRVLREKWDYYVSLECRRRAALGFFAWLGVCAENAKISALYLFRFGKNLLFCRGPRLPWRLERERHVYHFHICREFLKLVR